MFLNDDFLLTTDTAKRLYHDYAAKMPIIDYHCHLEARDIYENKNFKNITEAWLYGDHYKWRLMRANGIDESYITGDAEDYDKFLAWAKTISKAIGNPVYSWTHLELKRFFGVDLLLNEETAPKIWEIVNEQLQQDAFSRRLLIQNANVKVVCTTDDPIDDLEFHKRLSEEETNFKVFPAFRPDKALNIDAPTFLPWFSSLETRNDKAITSYTQFVEVLENRVQFFHDNDCRLSDHALDTLTYAKASDHELELIFQKAIKGQALSKLEVEQHKTATLIHLFAFYAQRDWTSQLHLKAFRNNNTFALNKLGPDTGFDAINDQPIINDIRALLDHANMNDNLPKTILYSLNPQDYPTLLTLMGSFQGGAKNKLQLGSGWWFNDTREGMRTQLTQFAEQSMIANFVGMLTDSRSFLSYTRHEYFRRVLCELIGEWEARGEVPQDYDILGPIVEAISYRNAHEFFGFNKYI